MDEISGNRVASRLITHSQPGIITLGNTSNNLIQNEKLDRKMGINGCLHCVFLLNKCYRCTGSICVKCHETSSTVDTEIIPRAALTHLLWVKKKRNNSKYKEPTAPRKWKSLQIFIKCMEEVDVSQIIVYVMLLWDKSRFGFVTLC